MTELQTTLMVFGRYRANSFTYQITEIQCIFGLRHLVARNTLNPGFQCIPLFCGHYQCILLVLDLYPRNTLNGPCLSKNTLNPGFQCIFWLWVQGLENTLNFSLVGGCSLICVFQIQGFGLREYVEFPHTWLADDCIEFTTAQNIHS